VGWGEEKAKAKVKAKRKRNATQLAQLTASGE